MATEIERKFLIDVESDEFKSLKPIKIQGICQAYIAKTDVITLRVRVLTEIADPEDLKDYDILQFSSARIGTTKCTVGIKGNRKGNVCSEFEYKIPYDDFLALTKEANAPTISKTRKVYEYGGRHIEVDFFDNVELGGLVMAEIEFNSFDESEAFIPPAWLGKEVSDDPAYTNRFLSEKLGIKD